MMDMWRAFFLGLAAPVAALMDPWQVPCPDSFAPEMCLGGWSSQQQRLKKQITANTPPPPPGRAAPAAAAPSPSPPYATLAYIRHLLQICIEIEHSTIPLYLTAVYSMRNTSSWEHGVILGVAIEEMLHMTNVANLFNAIGGHPDISKPSEATGERGPAQNEQRGKDARPAATSHVR